MSTEKIIKTQAKKYLSGNWTTVISAILALCTIGIALEGVFWLVTVYFKIINVETGVVNDDKAFLHAVILLSTLIVGFLLSPMINGIYKMFANLVKQKPCEINDMFYFFGNLGRYVRTVIMNTVLFVLFLIFSELTNVYNYTCVLLGTDYFQSLGFNLTTLVFILVGAVTLIIKALLYLILLNYPLIAYGFDDSKSITRYIFGYIELSLKNLGKTLKLVLSFILLILSCFFVAPAFYVVPYLLTSLINSAKWLFRLEEYK